jgi:IPT/TIG domain/FG-GAP repeat
VALSADGNTALIGGPVDNGEVGAAWVFTRSASIWLAHGSKLTGGGELGEGGFGASVALSSDGNSALVGGPSDNKAVGAAWVLTRSGSTWSQQGAKLTGGGELGEGRFGWSVALSSDGSTALIGGPFDDNHAGAAWVFENLPLAVTNVSPNQGPVAGGTTVTITGTAFTGATAVKFGATDATSFKVNSESSITAVSPAGTGTVHVTVTTPEGTSATSAADQFSYVAAPTITKVEPAEGPEAGGTSVTITGTNFNGTSAIMFGSRAAAGFKVNSESSITAVSPKGAGSVDVTVTTPGGTSPVSEADKFSYVPAPPTVTKVEPAAGPQAGGTSATITGTNLTGATAVRFGAASATSFKVTSATSISATSPAGSGTVDVTVTTPEGTSATGSADQFSYLASGPRPAVTKVAPAKGPSAGGTTVTITGSGFTGATAVKFGTANAAGFKVTSPGSITAVSPAHAKGAVDVTVTTPGGVSALVRKDRFRYAR